MCHHSRQDRIRMTFRPLVFILGAAVAVTLVACGSDRTYTDQKADGDYHLDEMQLDASDLPPGLTAQDLPNHEFDNAAWVDLFQSADPAGGQKQLDAQGRLLGYVATFAADQLGRVLGVTTFSTLYATADDARKAQGTNATDNVSQPGCGIPLNDAVIVEPFDVPKVADGAVGFFTPNYDSNPQDPNQAHGGTLRDTNICFRTGRILHVVQVESIPGVEDIALVVRLADRMLLHVNDSFDGKATPPPTAAPTSAIPALPSPNQSGGTQSTGTQPAATPSGGSPAATTPAGTAPAASPTR